MKEDNTGKRPAASLLAMNAIREARCPDLKSTHKAVLYAIATRLNGKRLSTQGQPLAWPSYERLAGDAGMARSTCVNTVESLREMGFLLKGTRKTDRGKSNLYAINVDKLKQWGRDRNYVPEEPTDPVPSTTRSSRPTAPQGTAPRPTAPRPTAPQGTSGISFEEYQQRFARRTA